jgi:hypothetical protein
MSSNLSVPRPVAAVDPAEAARQRGSVPGHAADTAQRAVAPEPAKPLPNPTLRLDPSLAIVVIEFRDEAGAVRSTIPSEQQLDAYRTWERGHVGAHGGTPGNPGSAGDDTSTAAAAPLRQAHGADRHEEGGDHGTVAD